MTVLIVTTAEDEGFEGTETQAASDGAGLSLREAIGLANARGLEDTIAFHPDLDGAVLRLTQGEIAITDSVTIIGSSAGSQGVILSGDALGDDLDANGQTYAAGGTGITDLGQSVDTRADNSRIFNISQDDADSTLVGLTLTGGYTNTENARGGALDLAFVPTEIHDSLFVNNATMGDQAHGGAISSYLGIVVTSSTFAGNRTEGATANGGAICIDFYGGYSVSPTFTNVTMTGNHTAGIGGGMAINPFVDASDVVTITNSLILGNAALDGAQDDLSGPVVLTGGNIIGDTLSRDGAPVQTGITADAVFAATAGVAGSGIPGGLALTNGGPLPTVGLSPDIANPALDASDDSRAIDILGDPLRADARGFFRSVDQLPPGGDVIDLGAYELAALLVGTDAGEILTGTDQADVIMGGEGDDDINGNRDNDTLSGGNDDDTVRGGVGDHMVSGDGGADRIYGGDGRDGLAGGDGRDTLFGGEGDDTLDGGGSGDLLQGGDGNDRLADGNGRDTLGGGAGADVFVLHNDGVRDRIDDFEIGLDRIALTGVTFADLVVRDLAGGGVRIDHWADHVILREGAGPLDATDFDASAFILS